MIYQQLPKTGFLLFLGKYYQSKNADSIPFCLKKTGLNPIYRIILRLISHFEKGGLRAASADLGVLHG